MKKVKIEMTMEVSDEFFEEEILQMVEDPEAFVSDAVDEIEVFSMQVKAEILE